VARSESHPGPGWLELFSRKLMARITVLPGKSETHCPGEDAPGQPPLGPRGGVRRRRHRRRWRRRRRRRQRGRRVGDPASVGRAFDNSMARLSRLSSAGPPPSPQLRAGPGPGRPPPQRLPSAPQRRSQPVSSDRDRDDPKMAMAAESPQSRPPGVTGSLIDGGGGGGGGGKKV
jgi:hypothetical protein